VSDPWDAGAVFLFGFISGVASSVLLAFLWSAW
jgi:hypothetical protein